MEGEERLVGEGGDCLYRTYIYISCSCPTQTRCYAVSICLPPAWAASQLADRGAAMVVLLHSAVLWQLPDAGLLNLQGLLKLLEGWLMR